MTSPGSLESLGDLATTIERMRAARPRASGPLIVGLAGAPGAGKSTIAAALSASLPGSAVLPMDGFHLPQAELVRLGVSPNALLVEARSDTEPVFYESMPAGEAENRRAEVFLEF